MNISGTLTLGVTFPLRLPFRFASTDSFHVHDIHNSFYINREDGHCQEAHYNNNLAL